jgi:hypothetical protein
MPNQELCNLMLYLWRYSQFSLMTHWDSFLSVYQTYQNLMVAGSCGMKTFTDGYQDDCTLDGS